MNSNNKVLLAILWPFGALVSALRNWRQPWAMNVFWVVCIYLGAIQIYCPDGTVLGEGADGGRYALNLIEMHNSMRSLWEEIVYNFAFRQSMDYYQIVLTWLISRVTDNGHVLFACFAAVFGFFYSRNMWYVLDRITTKCNWVIYVFIALLFLICAIWQINGVRMWTAAHIFVYALLPYIWEGDKKRLYWLIAVPLVHFSFLYVVVLSAMFVLMPMRIIENSRLVRISLIALFVTSMLVKSLNVASFANILEQYSPESYEDRIELYTTDSAQDNRESARKSVNWYVTASGDIKQWSVNILLLVLSLSSIRKSNEKKLLLYCLLISTIANIASLIPSGGRFVVLAHLFCLPFFLWKLTIESEKTRFNTIARLCAYPLLITIVFGIRTGFDYYPITLVFGNAFTLPFLESNVPLINFIK